MTVYSLPLALHFALDHTNMEQMEKEIPKKRPDKVHVPLGWQVFALNLPLGRVKQTFKPSEWQIKHRRQKFAENC